VQFALQHLIDHEPSMVTGLPRQPGQKEDRYAHLLSGEPDIPAAPAYSAPVTSSSVLEARVAELEAELEILRNRLTALENHSHD